MFYDIGKLGLYVIAGTADLNRRGRAPHGWQRLLMLRLTRKQHVLQHKSCRFVGRIERDDGVIGVPDGPVCQAVALRGRWENTATENCKAVVAKLGFSIGEKGYCKGLGSDE